MTLSLACCNFIESTRIKILDMKTRLFFQIVIPIILVLLFNNFLCSKEADLTLDCSANTKTIYSSGELLVNGSGQWYMNIANLSGGVYVADKNCHAEMYLMFSYKDIDLSETNIKPPIFIVFTGGDGFFDPGSVSYTSKEQFGGWYLWTAYCSQAAKNASENPTNYGMSVTWDPKQLDRDDVNLDGSITYTVYEPE